MFYQWIILCRHNVAEILPMWHWIWTLSLTHSGQVTYPCFLYWSCSTGGEGGMSVLTATLEQYRETLYNVHRGKQIIPYNSIVIWKYHEQRENRIFSLYYVRENVFHLKTYTFVLTLWHVVHKLWYVPLFNHKLPPHHPGTNHPPVKQPCTCNRGASSVYTSYQCAHRNMSTCMASIITTSFNTFFSQCHYQYLYIYGHLHLLV